MKRLSTVVKVLVFGNGPSNDDCSKEAAEPDVVMACCGDIPTMESLAATAILREEFPRTKSQVY